MNTKQICVYKHLALYGLPNISIFLDIVIVMVKAKVIVYATGLSL